MNFSILSLRAMRRPSLDHAASSDDASRRVELSAFFSFRAGKLAEKVLVDAAENVLRAMLRVAHANGADQVNQLPEPLLIQGWAVVLLGQDALERWIIALDRDRRVIDKLTDG